MRAHPPDEVVTHALQVAALSPCRSKRGAVIWNASTGSFLGHGFNAPPALLACPGREVCAGTCGQRAVHAETRAIYSAALARVPNLETSPITCDLLHVELAHALLLSPLPGGPRVERQGDRLDIHVGLAELVTLPGVVVACDGPSCGSCAALISDVGFIAGVWLFERDGRGWAGWNRYTADEFYEATMMRVAVDRGRSSGFTATIEGRLEHDD